MFFSKTLALALENFFPGSNHPLYCLSPLQHDYDKALPFYDRALKIYEENLGLDHPTVLGAVKNRQMAVDFLQSQV